MPFTHLAFLRAIGPITHKVMSMRALSEACEQAGFRDTRSYIASGNLLFNASAPEAELVAALNAVIASFGLHLDNQVFIRTPDQMTTIIADNPFRETAKARPDRLVAMFFNETLEPDLVQAALKHDGVERFQAIGRVLYGDYSQGIGTSKVAMGFIEQRLELRGTARNWNSVLKMQALALG